MAILRTSSGNIFRTTLPGSSLESGFDALLGSGSTAVISGGNLDLDVAGGSGGCVVGPVLPDDKVFVMRCLAQVNTSQNGNILMNVLDLAAAPSSIISDEDWVAARLPFLDFYTSGSPNRAIVEYAGGGYDVLLSTADVDTDYIWEFESDGSSWLSTLRSSALAVLGQTTKSWGTSDVPALSDHLYPLLGPISLSGWACADNTYGWWDCFISHEITVTGLDSGNAVRLYDASDDSVLASAVESGGMATLDCELVNWVGLTCYIKAFADDSYSVILDESEEMTDAAGGDVYEAGAMPPQSLKGPRLVTAKSAYVKLGDSAGAEKFVIQNADNENVWEVDSLGRSSLGDWVPAGQMWTFEGGSGPAYEFSEPVDASDKYSPGMRIRCTFDEDVQYFVVVDVGEYSDGKAVITVYGGTDYVLGEGISDPCYCSAHAPVGFPLDPEKWAIRVVSSTAQGVATPSQNVWYGSANAFSYGSEVSITIPIGVWRVSTQIQLTPVDDDLSAAYCTLSSDDDSQSDAQMTAYVGGAAGISSLVTREKTLTLTEETVFYLLLKTDLTGMDGIMVRGNISPTVICAECAYL